MSEFKRRLDRIEILKELAATSEGNWWKELLQRWQLPGKDAGSDGLRLAIRDNYLNFYRLGQSVARVGFDAKGTAYASVHLEYLGFPKPPKGKEYARLKNSVFSGSDYPDTPYQLGKTLPSIIKMAERWTRREKFMVDKLVAHTQSSVDLEIGLPRIGDKGGAPRMDLAVLEKDQNSDGVKLIFWEAKTIDDDRLRSTVPADAKVHKQLEKYEQFMGNEKRRLNATDQYRNYCILLVQLAKMAGKEADLSPFVRQVASGVALIVDPKPRLIILEGVTKEGLKETDGLSDCEVKRGRNWEKYERVIIENWTTKFSTRDGYQLT